MANHKIVVEWNYMDKKRNLTKMSGEVASLPYPGDGKTYKNKKYIIRGIVSGKYYGHQIFAEEI